ncbi:MAG: hypothetical protein L0229_13025 [Blastocatellia bacterium]|nr:hypothetical protein [Blastocatellia bacterium]
MLKTRQANRDLGAGGLRQCISSDYAQHGVRKKSLRKKSLRVQIILYSAGAGYLDTPHGLKFQNFSTVTERNKKQSLQ